MERKLSKYKNIESKWSEVSVEWEWHEIISTSYTLTPKEEEEEVKKRLRSWGRKTGWTMMRDRQRGEEINQPEGSKGEGRNGK